MKKFISLLTVAIMAVVAMVAEAKTVTVTLNNTDVAYVLNTSDYSTVEFTDGSATVQLTEGAGLIVVVTDRDYVASFTINGAPFPDEQIPYEAMPDGCTVAITAEKPQDKVVTVTIDNPNALNIINTSNGSSVTFLGEYSCQTVTIDGKSSLQINAASGYTIDVITVNGTVFPHESSSNVTINATAVPDNCTIIITSSQKKSFSYYIEGTAAHFDQILVNWDYDNRLTPANAVSGRWTVITDEPSQQLIIEAASGYVITSVQKVVTDGENIELLEDYDKNKSYVNMEINNVTASTTIRIATASLNDLRTAHVSIVLKNGTSSQIEVVRSSTTIQPTEFSDIAVIPNSESITIRSTSYVNPLYKVAVGERDVEPSYGDYVVSNLQDGDIINVWPDFPNENFPVTVTFTNEDTKDAIEMLTVDGENLTDEVLSTEGYTVKAGARLGFTFNNSSYTINSVTVDGKEQNTYGFQHIVTGATNVVIDATKIKGRMVTVFYVPGTIKIYNGNSTSDEPVTLKEDSEEVEFEVSAATSSIYIEPEEGYIITSIEDNSDEKYNPGSIYISRDNMEIYVDTEKFDRNQSATVYLQSDKQWSGAEMILSATNYSMSKNETLKKGYNTVEYAIQDRPFGFNVQPIADVYLNGTKATNESGAYTATSEYIPGDVIKIFEAGYTPENYSLNISVASSVSVKILADYVTPIEGTSATVFGPTDVEFVHMARAASAPFTVKVNGTEIAPDKEGKLIATINSNSTISVESNDVTSITEINAENADSALYNLQGVRVSNHQKGIFIKNGKKVIL